MWGAVFGIVDKIIGRLPSPEESIRNKINKLEREKSAILKQKSNPRRIARLNRIASELRVLYEKAKNK